MMLFKTYLKFIIFIKTISTNFISYANLKKNVENMFKKKFNLKY